MIIPSIDIMGGAVVQLRQGRERILTDGRRPEDLARLFGRFGPVAVVDLDAALGTGDNHEAVEACCRVARCRVGGGIRTAEDVRTWIKRGADQVVIGTAATPEFLAQFPAEWLIVAVDARGDDVLSHGWTRSTGGTLIETARALAPYCAGFLFTQVEREGELAGADLERAQALRAAVDRPITVAGGVSSNAEIGTLIEAGFAVQIGRALYENRIDLVEAWVDQVAFGPDGLVPTVVQDATTRDVLMLAYSNRESLATALAAGQGWYHSRSRGELWRKGGTSGHTQTLRAARWDCDRDTLLFEVDQIGPSCHRNVPTCFELTRPAVIDDLGATLERRRTAAGGSYTQQLMADPERLAGKLREEIEEVIDATAPDHIAWECADVLYHMMVYMTARGVSWDAVLAELRSRRKPEPLAVSA